MSPSTRTTPSAGRAMGAPARGPGQARGPAGRAPARTSRPPPVRRTTTVAVPSPATTRAAARAPARAPAPTPGPTARAPTPAPAGRPATTTPGPAAATTDVVVRGDSAPGHDSHHVRSPRFTVPLPKADRPTALTWAFACQPPSIVGNVGMGRTRSKEVPT